MLLNILTYELNLLMKIEFPRKFNLRYNLINFLLKIVSEFLQRDYGHLRY